MRGSTPPLPLRQSFDNPLMALLTLLDAQLAFGHVALLDHADFSLLEAERVGLIGRNGAGKSSLLKILGGLESPDDGQLQRQTGLRVAYVHQEPQIASTLTVFEAVSAGLAPVIALYERYMAHDPADDLDAIQTQLEALGGWTWEQRVTETLQRLHLDPTALVGSLSGGTRKRVALAQTFINSPEILLMDEPFGALDALTRVHMQDQLLDAWSREQRTVMFITHDVDEAVYLANRVIVMAARPGRLDQIIPVDLPYPRTEAIRLSPEFAAIRNRVWHAVYHQKPQTGQQSSHGQ